MPASVQPTLVRRLSDSGMTREEFCKKRGQGERAPPSVRTLDGTTHRPPCSMADAELAGFVSEKAADEYCRNNFAPRTLKRSGESRSKPHTTMPHGFRESISPLSVPRIDREQQAPGAAEELLELRDAAGETGPGGGEGLKLHLCERVRGRLCVFRGVPLLWVSGEWVLTSLHIRVVRGLPLTAVLFIGYSKALLGATCLRAYRH
jgi:hypothetical protein